MSNVSHPCPQNSSWGKGLDVRLSLAVALSIKQVTKMYLGSPPDPLNFEEERPEGVRDPSPTTREDLRLDGYLEYPNAGKAL
ncbi:hypothetical protein TNCV_1165581 [Trichonephila clavipes]|uniref:Uncharacterized protein n=1 Tax=Trichonephila clavipes TaxID=2585209 RepID=A0A8X6VT77_TRICX|nr:hypothetical protein TNCV_1165581 [Trichonephila clavipes]